MSDYASTYPQLINQAIAQGYGDDDLRQLRLTYDLVERAGDGVYRAQGVPISCHLVRAASIMLAIDQPTSVVQVAMIHGAYRMASFRDSRRRKVNTKQRALIRKELGDSAEALLWAYDQLPWYDLETVHDHLQKLSTYPPTTRQALLIRLADYLDDHLDRAMAFAGKVCDDPDARAYCKGCEQLAREMGVESLADEIAQAFEENCIAQLPDAVVTHRTRGYERPRKHLWEKTLFESSFIGLARWCYRRATRQSLLPGKTYGGTCETDGSSEKNL